MKHSRFVLSAIIVLSVTTACGSPAPGPRITVTHQPPPVSRAPTTIPTPSAVALGSATGDLRQFDWAQATLPGEFCDIDGIVDFSDGEAVASSNKWGEVHASVDSRAEYTHYGDIDGDGKVEAAVAVGCDNGGGTAAGQLGFGYVLVRAKGGNLIAIGTITPRQQLPSYTHVTLLTDARIERGKVIVKELWYRDSDGTCCPSGEALTTWNFRNDDLTPGETVQTS